jgi:hypothetical protein
MKKQSSKKLFVLGLFVFALLWVIFMWILDPARASGVPRELVSGGGGSSGGGGRARPMPRVDGTVKTEITRFNRDRAQISMNVTVTDKDGKVVTDLKPNDEFQVYEDGKLVKIKEFIPASQSGGIRIAFVTDYGPYVGKAERELAQAGIEHVLGKLKEENDQFGLYLNNLYYLQTGKRESVPMGPVSQQRRDLAVKSMDNILQYYSGGGILKTMGMALSKLAETRGRRILVVISNGHDDFHDIHIAQAPTKDLRAKYQDDHKKIISDLISSAKEKWNIPIYMLNPSTGGREDVCKQIATETGGEYHIAPTTGKLTDTLVRITEKVRNDYLVEYDSPNPKLDGNERKVSIMINADGSGSTADTQYRVEGVVSQGGDAPKEESSSSSPSGGGIKKAVSGLFRVMYQFLALALLLALFFAGPYFLWLGGRSGAEQPAAAAEAAPVAQVAPSATQPAPSSDRAAQLAKQLAIAQKGGQAPVAKGVAPPPVSAPKRGSAPGVLPKRGSSQGVPPGRTPPPSKGTPGGAEGKVW